MIQDLVIFGAGNYAEMAHYFFTEDSPHRVVAFTVDGEYLKDSSFNGLPVIAFEEIASAYPSDRAGMFVAIGLQKLNSVRAERAAGAAQLGYQLASFMSSHATGPVRLPLKPNTMIMDHVMLHPFVEIGANCVIWPTSAIAMKTKVEDHCWIVGATIGESVSVGAYSTIGLGAIVAPNLSIGVGNIIGAGALIAQDTGDHEVYKGQRAKPSKASSKRVGNWSILS